MNLRPTEHQQLIQRSMTDFFAAAYPFESHAQRLKNATLFDEKHWKTMAGLGWVGLGVREEHGGIGGGAEEAAMLMQAAGAVLNIEPLLATAVVAAPLLSRALQGDANPGHAQLLASVIAGDSTLALAWCEQPFGFAGMPLDSVTHQRDDGTWELHGEKVLVDHGADAEHLIVTTRFEGEWRSSVSVGLVLVSAKQKGVLRKASRLVDRTSVADIDFRGVEIDDANVLSRGTSACQLINGALASGIAGACAEAMGAIERAMEITATYLGERKQFGRSLSQFQALQHKYVDMQLAAERARSMTVLAAIRANEVCAGSSEAAFRDLRLAKVTVGQAARFVGETAVQLHGGMGMAYEYPIGHYYRKLLACDAHFGSQNAHLASLAGSSGQNVGWVQ